ncbi:MAG: acyl-CoA dehydrogenase, partial [Paracoccaceae bacterium]
ECHLVDGKVVVPDSYPALYGDFRKMWGQWQEGAEQGHAMPPIVQNLIIEMMMAGNASFMTYVGFSQPAKALLRHHGSDALNDLDGPALHNMDATACLCITEKDAGSDISRLRALATRQQDGRYLLTGHKWLISAGSHEMTDNIYYFVLARTDASQQGMTGLSCFLVPRRRIDSAGAHSIDNGIRTGQVVQKMGFKGCANTLLTFGDDGVETEAFLLGRMEGTGLQQLMMMMKPARISTGIFALGLASSAHETSVAYSRLRVQGKRFDQTMSTRAPSLPIAEHPDVRRMRLEMAAYTSGCRAIIARLGLYQSIEDEPTHAEDLRRSAQDISEILLPIVKAYTSDKAWRVCETAIQTHGGVGFTRDYPAQQNARDCKVLSIWEGTNHIQSLFLFRDKLGMCVQPRRLETLRAAILATVAQAEASGTFVTEATNLRGALGALDAATKAAGDCVRRQHMNDVPQFAVELQAGLGDIVLAWHLLEAAVIAQAAVPATAEDAAFYTDKVDIARHFLRRLLPQSAASLGAIAAEMTAIVAAAAAARTEAA